VADTGAACQQIFCTLDQVSKEVLGVLQFVEYVYDIFGMTFNLMLSTRPATAIGDVKLWDAAEASLAEALNEFCGDKRKQGVDPGGGAFYGPKIDIQVTDALGRPHQCATVQLDFQLPLRFDLQYQGPPKGDGTAGVAERPVIRASGQRRCLVHIIVDTYIYNIIGLYEHSILSSAPSRAAAHQPKTRIDSSSHTSVP
jgi:threonyl-tRNA synthetase